MSSWQVAQVLSEAQVTLQERRGTALGFQLLFRESTRGGMKVAAAEGLQLELDIRFLSFLGGPPAMAAPRTPPGWDPGQGGGASGARMCWPRAG